MEGALCWRGLGQAFLLLEQHPLVLLGLGRVNASRDGPRLDPWVVRGRSLCGCAELEVEVIAARLRGKVGLGHRFSGRLRIATNV